jgi:hypothetical protein
MLVESGTIVSSAGTGVRPGAEVWLATPFGTARYGDADLELTVAETRWSVRVRSGVVSTEPPLRPRGRPADSRLTAGAVASATATPNPDELTVACEKAAADARRSAEGVLAGGPKGLGERAASQLVLRQRARSACGSAAAAVHRVADPERRARLLDQISRADALWEGAPASATLGSSP